MALQASPVARPAEGLARPGRGGPREAARGTVAGRWRPGVRDRKPGRRAMGRDPPGPGADAQPPLEQGHPRRAVPPRRRRSRRLAERGRGLADARGGGRAARGVVDTHPGRRGRGVAAAIAAGRRRGGLGRPDRQPGAAERGRRPLAVPEPRVRREAASSRPCRSRSRSAAGWWGSSTPTASRSGPASPRATWPSSGCSPARPRSRSTRRASSSAPRRAPAPWRRFWPSSTRS